MKRKQQRSESKIKKVIVLGSGALRIGTAGEFDFSGAQAIKSLKKENIQVVLINPNIATIQTSWNFADKVYFLPVSPFFVERVIKKEKPDGIFLGFGGQKALNCGIALHKQGVFRKYKLRVLGTPVESIIKTEDRKLFAEELKKINVCTPKSIAAHNMAAVRRVAKHAKFPLMLRSGFSLGGKGSGIASNKKELLALAEKALASSPQILIEEYLEGWKELEYEVVRDSGNNCMTVCNMENIDPMGVHTGDSVVVAPSQTLTNHEYHMLRSIAIKVIQHFGIVGESNIQFALNPKNSEYRVIEINARLSRSSALASKATGYPLAYIAAKLGLGYQLSALENSMTRSTKAFFEPALDYIVVKFPRWDLQKFKMSSEQIGTEMKSVGEVMSIGRTFEEALQKAVRMLDVGKESIADDSTSLKNKKVLQRATNKRLFTVAKALENMSVESVSKFTKIDKWFLNKIKNIIHTKRALQREKLNALLLKKAKQQGFSDRHIAKLTGKKTESVRLLRKKQGIIPCVKQIDTLAAEYPVRTNYLYMTYNGTEDDTQADHGVLVLGSGTYRIGSSVEFDFCSVHALRALRKLGKKTVMINYNPETVSTDYDEADKLYFDELSVERVRDIYEKEQAEGVIVSVGGQIPNTHAVELAGAGIKILGTAAEDIDRAENRQKFSKLMATLGIKQPSWKQLTTLKEAEAFAKKIGYPVIIRPSYVLSGSAMQVIEDKEQLMEVLETLNRVSQEYPVVISKFIEQAKEIECDAVAHKGNILLYAISEHLENAGVHSGDATLVFPAQKVHADTAQKVLDNAKKIAAALRITGPFNIQFLAKENEVQVIECNVRASRSVPFISKIMRENIIGLATEVMLHKQKKKERPRTVEPQYVGVKSPQFSFSRVEGADPYLGVDMLSTGEAACIGKDQHEALLKSLLAVDFRIPKKNILLSIGASVNKMKFISQAKQLEAQGFTLYGTKGTSQFMKQQGVKIKHAWWPSENKKPNVLDYVRQQKIDLIINIPEKRKREMLSEGYVMRRSAVDYNVPLITNGELARQIIEALSRYTPEKLQIKSWDEYE